MEGWRVDELASGATKPLMPTRAPRSSCLRRAAALAVPVMLALSASRPALAQPEEAGASWFRLRPVAELGFLAVLSHKVQFSRDGTYFDYVGEGGQDTLFSVARFSAEAELVRRHQLVFLYQPLELDTKVTLERDVVVDRLTFPAGTPMALRYGFPFYRLSYAYDLAPDPRDELSVGVSLQIRNATIQFASLDGALLRSNRDVGPVPLLRSRGRLGLGRERGAFLGYEVDGIYAPISVLNGSDNEVTGALLDASLRAGVELPMAAEVFLNLRYLGGGAVGQSDDDPPSDGYTRNWLHLFTVSLGAAITTPGDRR